MATVQLPNATRSAACNAIVDLIDADSDPGVLRLYSGTQPAPGGAVDSQTLLAEFELNDPAFGDATDGVATLDVDGLLTEGLAAGTATWMRVLDGDDNVVFDGNVGTSGTVIELNTTTISIGVNVEITSGSFVIPSGA